MATNNGLRVYMQALSRAMELVGRGFPTEEGMGASLIRAGFVDVRVERVKVPVGPWAREERLKQV